MSDLKFHVPDYKSAFGGVRPEAPAPAPATAPVPATEEPVVSDESPEDDEV